MSGKLLVVIFVALAAYVLTTKTKVTVQPQVKLPETRWLPKVIKLPEVELVPDVNVTISEELPTEPEVELVSQPATPPEITKPKAAPVNYYYCGPNGCGPAYRPSYGSVRRVGPVRRLFGRR